MEKNVFALIRINYNLYVIHGFNIRYFITGYTFSVLMIIIITLFLN